MTNGTVSKGGITHPSLKKRIKNILKWIKKYWYNSLFYVQVAYIL
jgi:hypothetical protein